MNPIEVTEQTFQLYDKKANKVITVKAKKVGKNWMALCPKHDDHTPSLRIDEEDGSYHCFNPECGFSGSLFQGNKQIAEYIYCNESENPVFKVIRYGPLKGFEIQSSNKVGKWVKGANNINGILYRLSELKNSSADDLIFFVEGEKDVENLRKLGFIATTIHGSRLGENNKYFINKKVIILHDNDKHGICFSSNIAKEVNKVTDFVKWVELPGLKEKEDVSDWLKKGGTAEKLIKLAEAAPDFKDVVSDIINDENYKLSEKNSELSGSIEKKFNPRPYTKLLLDNYNIKSDIAGRLWNYDEVEGIWKSNAEDFLKSVLRKQYLRDEHLKNYCVNEVIADLQQYKYEGKYFEEPSPYLIPFKNKIYDLKNDKFIPFSPDFFFVNKIPVNIDTENKSCPFIDSILAAFVGEDFKIDLYELAAYCYYRDYPYNKFFILTGEGRNGKSTYINMVSKLIGSENVSAINLKDIISNRFAAASLFKKLVNISVETDPLLIRDTAIIKALTGEDPLSAEEKFEKRFQFRNYAKLIIVTNKSIKTNDLTLGFGKRVKIIHFEGRFIEGENADPFILEKITKAELEGFAWVCLETIKNLYKRGFVFTIAQEYEGITALYDDKIQRLSAFLEEKVTKDPASDISTVEFLDLFNEYLEVERISKITQYKLINAMESMGYVKKAKNIMTESGWTTKSVWDGIRWQQ